MTDSDTPQFPAGEDRTMSASPEPSPDQPIVASPDQPLEKPADSRITFLPTSESLTFIIPRTGFRDAAGFALVFALFWNLGAWAATLILLVRFVSQPGVATFLPVPLSALSVVIGAALFLFAIQMAFRKSVFVATPDLLVYNQIGPARKTEINWPAAEILDIRADYSGTDIGDRRFRELRIHTAAGHQGFFDARDDAELSWLADTLRRFYGLPRQPPEPPESDSINDDSLDDSSADADDSAESAAD